MQRIAAFTLCLSLIGCAQHHDIEFLIDPCLIPYKRFDFKLCSDFNVRVDNVMFCVPKSFQTDLASVPRFMWWIYSPNDSRTIPAAILHDYMYSFNVGVTRKEADDIFYNSLIKSGTKKRTAIKYYIGVRWFGWMFYHK